MAASWHAVGMPATRRQSRSFLFVKLWLIFAPLLAIVLWFSNVPESWFAYLIIASAVAIALSMRHADGSSTRRGRRPMWTRSQRSRVSVARTKPRTPVVRPPQRGARGPALARQPRPRPAPCRGRSDATEGLEPVAGSSSPFTVRHRDLVVPLRTSNPCFGPEIGVVLPLLFGDEPQGSRPGQ